MEGGTPSAEFKFLYPYPEYLRELVVVNFNEKFISDDLLKRELSKLKEFGRRGLRKENYHEWFEIQLWIEEIEREINLQHFHLDGVTMIINETDRIATLHVPGVAEKHPAILTGDSVFVRLPSEVPSVPYEGIVHDVVFIDETLHLGFGDEFLFKYRTGMKVNVQFWFSRSNFIRCHAALQHASKILRILFPTPSLTINEGKLKKIEFCDPRVGQNKMQRQAVEAIVNRVSAPAPYIIFGPPGTGKTSTMVEAIKQVYKQNVNDNILVCGPSNASCDILTEGLLKHISANKILRVNARSRGRAGISDKVWKVSSHEGNFSTIPTMDMLRSYNIVIATYSTAYRVLPLMREKSTECAYTHVFLDECGYTVEPEALIPLLAFPKMVVLAGDPCQLGPVVTNMNALKISLFKGPKKDLQKGFRMDQSLLERLMALPMYKSNAGHYNHQYITKLVNNYRSHARILEIPNKLFYEDQLVARGDRNVLNSMLNWNKLANKKSRLPNPDIPIVFHFVNGREERRANNPSFFNVFEVARVVQYVRRLMREMRVKPEDIGIVTPYREQMRKVKFEPKCVFLNG
ncbi:hypothetical protein HAZT_HAZT004202 [Hyalella azteca]|uniref:RNA helicase n=1 Tax=Hyalella azteca TaxID=294128 RepID=A0A6A0GXN6_HYAAZ|nr:hypothetical protein HAZT_HAZT004202 [Hyalella azteca]